MSGMSDTEHMDNNNKAKYWIVEYILCKEMERRLH